MPKLGRPFETCSAIAPLHNAAGLQGIELVEKLFPDVPQVAVFDTGFHRTLPLPAKVYPGPYEWFEHDIRRYGFHGINHEYCAHRAAHLLKRELATLKIVSCHLGNGCSLAAIDGGKSVDTTMGFTPLEGITMGTRSGSVDPGILIHLMRTETASAKDWTKRSIGTQDYWGFPASRATCGTCLEAVAKGNDRAKLAVEIFIHRLRAGIAAMAASLGGLDVIVFTAGIGKMRPRSGAIPAPKCASLELNSMTQKILQPNSMPKSPRPSPPFACW